MAGTSAVTHTTELITIINDKDKDFILNLIKEIDDNNLKDDFIKNILDLYLSPRSWKVSSDENNA
jgi:hypothetical protein